MVNLGQTHSKAPTDPIFKSPEPIRNFGWPLPCAQEERGNKGYTGGLSPTSGSTIRVSWKDEEERPRQDRTQPLMSKQ